MQAACIQDQPSSVLGENEGRHSPQLANAPAFRYNKHGAEVKAGRLNQEERRRCNEDG